MCDILNYMISVMIFDTPAETRVYRYCKGDIGIQCQAACVSELIAVRLERFLLDNLPFRFA